MGAHGPAEGLSFLLVQPLPLQLLLSDEAKKSARRRPTPARSPGPPSSPPELDAAVSHWKVRRGVLVVAGASAKHVQRAEGVQ